MEYNFKKPNTTVVLTNDGVIFKRGTNDLMIHKSLRGETKVLFSQIQQIEFKEATLMSGGYLQLTTARNSMVGMLRTVDQPQNAVKFKKEQNDEALDLKKQIESNINNHNKSESFSSLKELKSLLDEGIITHEEFDTKKKQILNI